VRGQYSVETGQIGGFDATYGSLNDFPICSAYVRALQSILCDPKQSMFIRENDSANGSIAYFVFVNPRSCDAVFVNCSLPGEVFPDWATYNDSPTLC
jgi:hypothetical protein